MISATIFWISVILVFYIYIGYPLLVRSLALVFPKEIRKEASVPRVTVLIAAYNEAEHIEETVRNKLNQDYPPERLDIIVMSDESTDGTDAIVIGLGPRVQLIRQAPRAGKTAALNIGVQAARGDILIFSDANSIYDSRAIREIVGNFSDSSVGYVTGKMVYVTADGSMVGDGCSAYMRYENWLRAEESQFSSVIGVDGGIDATRKSLYEPMRADQLPDFVLPLSVAARGYRIVYEPKALLKEVALSEHGSEFRMRVRVSLRALWALWDLRQLMNPFRHGMLAVQIVSHKLLRYLAFLPLSLILLANLALLDQGGIYQLALALQAAFYLLALLGWLGSFATMPSLVAIPYYFLLLNLASARAALRFIRGERQATWVPRAG